MRTESIIFDVDGTLWDATAQIADAYNVMIEKDGRLKKHITKRDVEGVMGMVTEEIAQIFFSELSQQERVKLIDDCCEFECTYLLEHGGMLYPSVEMVLEQLSKKYRLFIVSNCQDGYVETLYSLYDIKKYIHDFECSGRTGLPKGENLKLIMERNHIKDVVYVGDTQKDKDACEYANIPFLYASYGFGKVDGCDGTINIFEELLDIF